MLVTFEKLTDISTKRISFYSAKFYKQQLNEWQKFCNKQFPEHEQELQILKKIIAEMQYRGAKPYYFEKPEMGAYALPSVSPDIKDGNKKDFGIRLYCLYLSPEIVVLLNGGIKTKSSAKLCPNVSGFFNHAVKLADKMKKAKESDFVRYDGLELEFDDDYFIDI